MPCYWYINFYAIDVSVNRQMTLKLFMALATKHKELTENRIWWQSVIETDDANNIVGKSIKLNVEENKNAPIHQHNHKNIESIKCIKIKSFWVWEKWNFNMILTTTTKVLLLKSLWIKNLSHHPLLILKNISYIHIYLSMSCLQLQ